jgi:hypothetical protein
VCERIPWILLTPAEASERSIPDHPFVQCHLELVRAKPKRSVTLYSAVPPPRSLLAGGVCEGGAWL